MMMHSNSILLNNAITDYGIDRLLIVINCT
jgi:hypothetical protein